MSSRDKHPRARQPFLYVDTPAALRDVVERLADCQRFGLDTEFVGERTFLPQLELIQVASDNVCALIDCRSIDRLDDFFALLGDARIEKVLHAGQQDLELFHGLARQDTVAVFDTQVAAAMVGLGAQVGYAPLVERLLGIALEKTETLTDWSHRPLTSAQLEYAADDVRHLLPLHARLRERLGELEREGWAAEEFLRLERSAAQGDVEPSEAYRRVRGRGTLRAKGLAILRELAAWREQEARRRNKPRGTILRDELLVELARRAPETPNSLRGLRALRSRELERSSDEIIAAVQRALALPRSAWPEPPRHGGATASTGLVEALQAILRLRAEQAHIAPTLVATTSDLERLAAHHHDPETNDFAVLQGWRRQIAGDDLLRFLGGRAAIRLDRSTHRLRIDDRGD
jgi:ribonuclease D